MSSKKKKEQIIKHLKYICKKHEDYLFKDVNQTKKSFISLNKYIEDLSREKIQQITSKFLKWFEKKRKLDPETLKEEIEWINHNAHNSDFIDPYDGTVTELFLITQKYNYMMQELEANSKHLVQRVEIPDISPIKFESVRLFTDHLLQEQLAPSEEQGKFFYPGDEKRLNQILAKHEKIIQESKKRELSHKLCRGLETLSLNLLKMLNFFKQQRYFKESDDIRATFVEYSPLKMNEEQPSSTYLGHGTHLLQIPLYDENFLDRKTINILTDPVEADLQWYFKRECPSAYALGELPQIHFVLISGKNALQFDEKSLKTLQMYQAMMIVPLGLKDELLEMGFQNVCEMNWWDCAHISMSSQGQDYEMIFHCVPSRSYTGTSEKELNDSLFSGFVVEANGLASPIYYSGFGGRMHAEHIHLIRDHFQCLWMYQTAGFDQNLDHFSDHFQSTSEALYMHFSLLVRNVYHYNLSKAEFLKRCFQLRTQLSHHKGFHFGSRKYSDSQEVIDRFKGILNALGDIYPLSFHLYQHTYKLIKEYQELKDNEKINFYDLLLICHRFQFGENEFLTAHDALDIIERGIVNPNIGQKMYWLPQIPIEIEVEED